MKNKRLKFKKGYALLNVLVVMVVLSILFIVVNTLLQSNINQIATQEKQLQAHYFARSGAGLAYTAITDSANTVLKDEVLVANSTKPKKTIIEFKDENAKANISSWTDGSYIIIKSKSEMGKYSSTIYLKVQKNNLERVSWHKNLN